MDMPEDDLERLVRLVSAVARPPDSGLGQLKAVIVGVGTTLLAAFIVGAWILSNQFYALQAQVGEWEKATDARLVRLENRP